MVLLPKSLPGDNGFGFDEIFELPNGKTLSELSQEEKNKISARRIALEKIKNNLYNAPWPLFIAKRKDAPHEILRNSTP